ncbi:hypothetical protein OAD26_00185 [bacterium]|nr:hypothetical protein [bacterium]
MSNVISDLENYFQLVHITKAEGEKVDWYGWFVWLDGPITEGFAVKAELSENGPVLKWVRDGYCVRLYTENTEYTPLGYFKWKRRSDKVNMVKNEPEAASILCIQVDSVKDDDILGKFPFSKMTRKEVTFSPSLDGGQAIVSLTFQDEKPLN